MTYLEERVQCLEEASIVLPAVRKAALGDCGDVVRQATLVKCHIPVQAHTHTMYRL